MPPASVNPQGIFSFHADSTIAAYRVVRATGVAMQVALHNTTTAHILGVTINDSQGGSDSSIAVATAGIVKCACASSVSAGSIVTAQSATASGLIEMAGNTVNSTTTSAVPKLLGIALQSGSTNSVIAVALNISNANKTAYA